MIIPETGHFVEISCRYFEQQICYHQRNIRLDSQCSLKCHHYTRQREGDQGYCPEELRLN